jgi:hypothetical protein
MDDETLIGEKMRKAWTWMDEETLVGGEDEEEEKMRKPCTWNGGGNPVLGRRWGNPGRGLEEETLVGGEDEETLDVGWRRKPCFGEKMRKSWTWTGGGNPGWRRRWGNPGRGMEEETLVGGEDEETLDVEWRRKPCFGEKMRKSWTWTGGGNPGWRRRWENPRRAIDEETLFGEKSRKPWTWNGWGKPGWGRRWVNPVVE